MENAKEINWDPSCCFPGAKTYSLAIVDSLLVIKAEMHDGSTEVWESDTGHIWAKQPLEKYSFDDIPVLGDSAIYEIMKLKDRISARGFGVMKKLIQAATILREGWEMDNYAWLVEMEDGSRKAFTTNHGGLCELSREELNSAIEETERSLKSLQVLMSRISG